MSPAKRSTGRKSASGASKKARRKTTAKKTSAKRSGAKKGAGKKTASRTAAKKTAKKSTAKKSTSKKSTRKKTAKKSTSPKTSAKKSSKKRSSPKKTTGRKSAAKKRSGRSGAKKADTTAPVMNRPPAPKRRVRPAKLDKKMLAAIREKLESDRVELEEQLAEIERDSITESEDTGLHEDFADAGTSTFERERDLSIRNNVLDLLDQVKRAVTRIDEGVYGTCENCGRPIDAARIKAFPRILMCLDCKRRDERTR